MLKLVVVSITYRTLNNIAPALQALVQRGARCEVIWAPTTQRVDGQSPRAFGLNVAAEFAGLQATDPAELARFGAECRRRLVELQPDLVLSDDMTTWPNRAMYEQVCTSSTRPWQLAWQHGFHQPWYDMRQSFHADFFLCYGRVHAFLMGQARAERVLPIGLPKLDALAAVIPESGGYLSWFAQPQPDARQQIELLAAVAKTTGRPVRIRPHPASPNSFSDMGDLASRGLTVDDPASDPVDALRRCEAFLSTHSSAAIEALLLGKSAILFPSFGLTSFPGYPNVASEFSATAYQAAVKRLPARRAATEAFLADCIGGRRFDHTERAVRAVEEIAALRRSGVAITDVSASHLALAQEFN